MLTESLNEFSKDIDALSIKEILKIMNQEDRKVLDAVSNAIDPISKAVDVAISTIRSGGRLIYIGAGTSGRLGVLDASEMPPTFNVSDDTVKAIIAGGERALTKAIEGAEDDEDAGKTDVSDVKSKDMILGISASGKTPYVISALKEAKIIKGAKCWLLTCNDINYDFLDGIINIIVGPEIVAGSTRLKAATATKIVLNMISTTTMIKLGKVYKGYMVDVVPSNKKLTQRALRIIKDITGCSDEEAEEYLYKAKGNAKTAILMYLKKIDYEDAIGILKDSGGSLRSALAK